MDMEIFVKDPSAIVDYGIDWGAGYLSENEAINSSSWDIFPKGGVIRKIYRLTNRIITSAGRSDACTIIIKIGER